MKTKYIINKPIEIGHIIRDLGGEAIPIESPAWDIPPLTNVYHLEGVTIARRLAGCEITVYYSDIKSLERAIKMLESKGLSFEKL